MQDDSKDRIKQLLKKVTEHTSAEEMEVLKKNFKETIKDANPLVIAAAEAELIKEGGTIEDLMKACDVHLELFKDAIRNPNLKVPEGHPIASFQQDHKNILTMMEKLIDEIKTAKKVGNKDDAKVELMMIEKLMDKLMETENHNVRQENTLFPVLEKHGIEQPPAIMWHDHTEMKEHKKKMLALIKSRDSMGFEAFLERLLPMAVALLEKFG
ncbi:MAG TPA: DUF438 domain-containing protein, partial [Candidatus Goldiibacteriota bacterium]|nr:DUF438 domain-containing protein [Candidatus Goldiibacteriota bacterium]